MNIPIELCFAYHDVRKLIFFNPIMSLPDFKLHLKAEFNLPNEEIKIIDMTRNAELTSTLSFRHEREYSIMVSEGRVNVIEAPRQQANIQDQDPRTIEYSNLLEKQFHEEDLLERLNAWANPKRFQLVYTEGKKLLKKRVKRTLGCPVDTCTYKIIFTAEEGNSFKVYEKLSKKYKTHSIFFSFSFF